MAWDVTVPDTFAESYIDNTARESGAAADRASAYKANKYSSFSNSHIFYPVAVETAGAWNRLAIELCLLYTSPSPRDRQKSRMPSSA